MLRFIGRAIVTMFCVGIMLGSALAVGAVLCGAGYRQ